LEAFPKNKAALSVKGSFIMTMQQLFSCWTT